MSRLKAVAALLVLIVTNAFVLGGVAWNRSGEPTGRIVFDQCELDSFKGWPELNEAVRYAVLSFESQQIDEDTVRKLYGFELEAEKDAKWFKRRFFVVLKHGGSEWDEYLEHRPHGSYGRYKSELIFIDGDTDHANLREKYPGTEGRAIMVGYVTRRHMLEDGSKGYFWESTSRRVAIDSQYRETVKAIRDARLSLERESFKADQEYLRQSCEPTHRITVSWGRRLEPWISSIEAM